MIDIYLKFKDRAAMEAALLLLGVSDDNANILVDEIGIITECVVEGEEPKFTVKAGYHVNVRLLHTINIDALKEYIVNPVTPVRVWG